MTIAARLAAYYFAFFAHAGAYVSYFALYLAGARHDGGRDRLCGGDAAGRAHRRAGALGLACRCLGRALRRRAQRAIIVFSAFAMLAGFVALPFLDERAGDRAAAAG